MNEDENFETWVNSQKISGCQNADEANDSQCDVPVEQVCKLDESFIFLKKGYALRDTTDGLFRQLGITPKITFEGEEVATAAGLVAAGLGVSLLPDVGLDKSKIVYIPIRQPACKRVIGIAFSKERYLSPAASQFKQFVIDHFGRMESI
ncbi:hypothetical protein FOI68_15320 [Brevibacillus sp. LEMMJ03]|nr:LysR substrate-binding domain-containing protein [Brevibacillus sp. LEMMJ03]TRY24893.1 hypothetical protein FOI68_15320 [Brevibacillus sp. LEMMJ03]